MIKSRFNDYMIHTDVYEINENIQLKCKKIYFDDNNSENNKQNIFFLQYLIFNKNHRKCEVKFQLCLTNEKNDETIQILRPSSMDWDLNDDDEMENLDGEYDQVVTLKCKIDRLSEFPVCSVIRKFSIDQLRDYELIDFINDDLTVDKVRMNPNLFYLHYKSKSKSLDQPDLIHQIGVKFIDPTEYAIEWELYENMIQTQSTIHQLNLLYAKEQINIESLPFDECVTFLNN